MLALGEAPDRVYNIGSPELDTHARPSGVTIEEVKSRYAIPFDNYGIVIFHPVTSEFSTMGAQAKGLFDTLKASDKNFVVIAPNNDPGTDDIFAVIEALPKDQFRLIPSMRFNYFSELMKNASAMIGNSSAGVREAPFLGLPSLDVGSRQNNRALADSVSACGALDDKSIQNFLTFRWGKRLTTDPGYGDGQAMHHFVQIIGTHEFWGKSGQKVFH